MTDPIPHFEGHPVSSTAVKLKGSSPLESLEGLVIGMDDVVQMVNQYRCVGVFHTVNDATGEICRQQILKPFEAVLAPIDPDDPSDIGILRSPLNRTLALSAPVHDDDRENPETPTDVLLRQSCELIVSTQFGSTSMLQRKLAVTLARAEQIMGVLEEAGIVGPAVGAQARDVLVKAEDFEGVLDALWPLDGEG